MKTNRRDFLRRTSIIGMTAAVAPVLLQDPAPTFPELAVTGSHGAMGLVHGKKFARQVKHNVAYYLNYLSKATHRTSKEVLTRAREFGPVIAKHVPKLFEEIEGIARGAGCPLDEILAVNARSDLLVVGRKKRKEVPVASERVPGCTALALEGNLDGAELLALGQNWDWNRALRDNTIVLRLNPANGPRIVTFTEAGMVGKIGFNDRRLGVCLNFLRHRQDDPEREPGVPVHCLLRAVMGCDTLQDAVELVSRAPRCASANFLMAQNGREDRIALDLEWTPVATGRLPMKDGILVHTNHFKENSLGGNVTTGNSCQRDARALRMGAEFAKAVPDPVERMMKILSLSDKRPVPLSRNSTQAGVVMDLTRNRLFLSVGPPRPGQWVSRPGT